MLKIIFIWLQFLLFILCWYISFQVLFFTKRFHWKMFNLLNVNIFLIFSLYYLFYFFEFYQGESSAPSFLINSIKFLLLTSLILILILKKLITLKNIRIFFFVNGIFFLYISLKFFFGLSDFLFFNFIIFSFLILLKDDVSFYLLKILSYILTLQVFIDLLFRLFGVQNLWLNGAFVGGMGNPSTFGMTCIFLLYFYRFKLINQNLPSFIPFLLCLGAVLSQSLLALIFIFLYLSLFHRKLFFLFICLSYLFSFFSILDFHSLSKINSLVSDGVFSNRNSESVYGRVDWFLEHFHRIENGQLSLLVGDIGNYGFISGDNGILSIFSLGGLPLVFIFIYFVLTSFFKGFTPKFNSDNFFIIFCTLYFFSFFAFNRSLEYFPFSFIFFTAICYLRSFTVPNYAKTLN